MPQGVHHTIGRLSAVRAGLPVSVAGMTIDRQCASGLMAIATAAKQVVVDRMNVVVAGGVESISLVQTQQMRVNPDPDLLTMVRSEEHTSELQSLMRTPYAVFCLKKKNTSIQLQQQVT